MIKYPSIDQFRNAVKMVQHRTWYAGKDENGNSIFDESRILPTLQFRGYTKLHGTNAGVVYDYESEDFYCQSRSNVITPEKDNAGFAAFMQDKKEYVKAIADEIFEILGTNIHPTKIAIYGEWCGEGIQKGVAVNELPKMLVIFGARVFLDDPPLLDLLDDEQSIWIDPNEFTELFPGQRIYNIASFGWHTIDIDFNDPAASLPALEEMVKNVDDVCPVAREFGVLGTGEGIVFQCIDPQVDYEIWFKVKGDKHQITKTKEKIPINPEVMENINKLIDSVVTEERLEWALNDLITEQNLEFTPQNMGAFLKTVANDVLKEETDTIEASGFEPKQLNRYISNKARPWYMEKLDEQVFS